MDEKRIILKPGREKSIWMRHPWIFSGAIARTDGDLSGGDTAIVVDSKGNQLGPAAFSPASSIRARMWSFDPEETVDADFFSKRIQAAANLRRMVVPEGETNAVRLVHAESDGLPGLIVDRYADTLVVQVLTAEIEAWKEAIFDILGGLNGVRRIIERSDAEVRTLEGLAERNGTVRGETFEGKIEIIENGLKFGVDVMAGQKTGFFIDQRDNRRVVGKLCRDREVLNCFCYTGGFSVYGLAGGATRTTSIDTSEQALVDLDENLARNALDPSQNESIHGDVFKELRKFRDQRRSFDLVVLDPPKFAPTAAQAERAARGYKDINLLAFKLLRPGGILATFSCSGGISADLFQKIVAGAALDAGIDAKIVATLHQGADHPVALSFPEGTYLKGLICAVKQGTLIFFIPQIFPEIRALVQQHSS